MPLRQRLENLPVGNKLLVALIVLLCAVLVVANLVFISAAYWISRQSVAPQAMQSIGELMATDALSQTALASPASAQLLLKRLETYAPLRAAAIYDAKGQRLAHLYTDEDLDLPLFYRDLDAWRLNEFRANQLVELPQPEGPPGHLLLVASSELPGAFFTGTLTASLAILVVSLLLWGLVARQIRKFITKPIRRLEELSRRVTREENYALRARAKTGDEIGRLADAFNTMLSRMQARESQLKRARDDARTALDKAQTLAEETYRSNCQLEMEIKVRRKVEQKLTGFQNYLNSIIDSMPSALIAVDEELQVTQWNQEASLLSGTHLDDALNRPLLHAFAPLKPYITQIRRAASALEVERVERVTWQRGEEARHYELTFYPLVGGGGRGVVIRVDDITRRIELEQIMVQSEKMRSVGGLAAGMAHEINNPLGAILHNAQNIRRRLSSELERNREVAESVPVELDALNTYLEQRQIPQLLDGIQQAGGRAARIVSHMLSFSRMSGRQMTECRLPALIDQAVEIAGSDFDLSGGFDFRMLLIERDFDPRVESIHCIANELEQVLLNLLMNAAQAIHQKASSEPGRIILRTRLNPPWAEIQVEDNGSGMPEHVARRIFEPFFTTKEVGQGTGLGLSVSYFIITNNHKGQMDVQSRPGQGTTFTVRLPLGAGADSAP